MENYKVFFDNLTINLYEWRTYERKALTETLSSVKRYCLINPFFTERR